ncbi:uncharacterized protein SETTUDRAFT_167822 [Exserohilum turcica Et28A]|uniref:Uncharacterized protein n=1 Tax=Exserohilum turcicum (strain 28A) TaxID=671987 RepID=R0KJE0_EXST2|nr:uncharacterized protein SETTUDRAFT_167822 [Exserohilum turcica Et28A]EOA89294.1 hypothetical protein SETTUDRAFT_167822 [Exserohilum turcica Et28A]
MDTQKSVEHSQSHRHFAFCAAAERCLLERCQPQETTGISKSGEKKATVVPALVDTREDTTAPLHRLTRTVVRRGKRCSRKDCRTEDHEIRAECLNLAAVALYRDTTK